MLRYTCNGSYANVIRHSNFSNLTSNLAKITMEDCEFENFTEFMHVAGGQYDIRNCIFRGDLTNDFTHAIHIPGYGLLPNFDYRPIHFSGNKFYDIPIVFTLEQTKGATFGDINFARNEFYNCGADLTNRNIFSYWSLLDNIWVENNYFSNCKNVGPATYFGNNEFVNTRKAITSTTYAKDNVFTNYYKQNSSFLDVSSGNQFMIDNTINQLAPNTITKYPNAGYIKSGNGSLFIEGGSFNGGNQTRYVDNSTAKLDISRETVVGGTLITSGVADYDIYNTTINKVGGFAGFHINMSNGTICNSSSQNATRAFSFRGNCMNTSLSENEIGTSGIGLYIDNIIGPQDHKGNTWEGTYSSKGATNTSTSPFFSQFTVNSNPLAGGNSLFIPQNGNYSPATFFIPDESTNEIDECIYEFGPNGLIISDIDLSIINNTFNIDPLSNWLAVRNLIRKILNNPALLNDINVNNWYQNQINTPVATTAEIEEILAGYYGDDNEVKTIRQVFEDYESGTYSAIEADHELNLIQSIIKINQNQKYIHVGNLLGSYTPTNVFEEVFEETYHIYIEVLNDKDYLPTSQELSTLTQNANLCPLTFGPSVYIAQSLAKKYQVRYDEDNCTISRKRSQIAIVNNELKLYPNPANDIVNIEMDGDIILAEVISVEGKTCITSTSKTIEIKSLASGLYYVKVQNDNGIIHVSQLVIQN